MKVVFVSNYLNQHLMFLCESFISNCKDLYFLATDSEYRQGYQVAFNKEYVVYYDKIGERDRVLDLLTQADVAIMGACPDELIDLRVSTGKLTFLYSERFFKKGAWRRLIPRTRKAVYNRAIKYKNNDNFYILCASAYLPYDVSLLGFPNGKCFKWGYFPQAKRYKNIEEIIAAKGESSILWASRFLEWKHPEIPIKLAAKLKADGYRFELNMIGDGICHAKTEKLIKKYHLEDCVNLLGSMSSEEVRDYMEQSEIFLFTSDRREGWGAVLNESMNSGCAVVANKAIGSAPYLIKDGENGFIYNGTLKDIYNKVKFLFDNPEIRKETGKNAYYSIIDMWNADVAAERLLKTAGILCTDNRKAGLYQDGPCSTANIVKG